MPTQMRASAFFRRGFLAPRSRASVPARSRGLDPAPAHDDDDSSSSDDGGPQVYTAPRPASTLSIGETPLIGRAGRAIFGCGFRSLPICFCLRPCPAPSCSPDEALTDAAVHRRSRGKLYVDYLYLESILAPELRRIFATDTVQLGTRPCVPAAVCNPSLFCAPRQPRCLTLGLQRARRGRRPRTASPAAANPKVTLSPSRYLKIFGVPLYPPVRPAPRAAQRLTRSHLRSAVQRPPKQARFKHVWSDELDVDVDADVPGVAWLLLATDPWNILLNTAGILDATGLVDIGALKEAICVRARFLVLKALGIRY